MKRGMAETLSIIIAGVFLSLILNLVYSSWTGSVQEAKRELEYDAVTRSPVKLSERSIFEAHRNIAGTSIIRDLKAGRALGVSCCLEERSTEEEISYSLLCGRYPRSSRELIISEEFMKSCGLEVGDSVELELGRRMQGEKEIYPSEFDAVGEVFEADRDRQYKISGIFHNPEGRIVTRPYAVTVYDPAEQEPDEKVYIGIVFKNKNLGYRTLSDLSELMYGVDTEYSEFFFANERMLELYGASKTGGVYLSPILAQGVVIVVGAVLIFVYMLKNIYMVWAIRGIRELAMYKSIGATRRQIRSIVIRNALRQGIPAVVVSLLAGNILSYLILNFYTSFVSTNSMNLTGQYFSSKYHFSPLISFLTCVFILFTILVSASIPAGKLSKMNIISALKGEYEYRTAIKKRVRKNFESELRVNNSALYASSANLLVLTYTVMLFLFAIIGTVSANYDYSKYECPYDAKLMMWTSESLIPEAFRQIEADGNTMSSLVTMKAYANMRVDGHESKEFASAGFYKKAKGALYIEENGINKCFVNLIGLSNRDFEKLTGGKAYRGAVVLNKVRRDFKKGVAGADYIPFISESKYLELESDYGELFKLPVSEYISGTGLKLLDENIVGYDLNVFLPVDELTELIMTKLKTGDDEGGLIEYNMNIKTVEASEASFYDAVMKHTAKAGERFQVEDISIREKGHELSEVFIQYLFYTIMMVVIMITLSGVYNTVKMFFRTRCKELMVLRSVGMTAGEMRRLLLTDCIYFITRPLLFIAPILMIIAYVIAMNTVEVTPIHILRRIQYDRMALVLFVINIMIAVFFLIEVKELSRLGIAEEIQRGV